RLGLPVVETVAVKRGGARGLIERVDGNVPTAAPAQPEDAASHADLHAQVRELLAATVSMPRTTAALDDALDRWALHPVFGLAILAVVMFLVFQAVYAAGKPMSDLIGDGFGWMGEHVAALMPAGPLQSLVIDGLFGGLGTVVGFLLVRLMLSVGLTGRSFIPLLSSFACAIPGIMGTRSIQDPRDRLATILIA